MLDINRSDGFLHNSINFFHKTLYLKNLFKNINYDSAMPWDGGLA